jgi:integrase
LAGIADSTHLDTRKMATNKLTDHQCRGAKPKDKPYKLSDGHGMYLYVSITGAKVWRMGYRANSKEQTQVLGPYPLLSLADARTKRDEFRRKLLDGVDVKAKPKKIPTFSEAVKAYWVGRKGVSENYLANATRGLHMHLEYAIGKDPIDTITKQRLLALLLILDAAGKHVYARRVRVWAGQVFDWAIEQGHREDNPATQINPEKAFGRKPVQHHAAIKLSQVPGFMGRLTMDAKLQSAMACRFLALTWVRTNEMRFMVWSEIEGDLWRIPGKRMKKKREHLVPLSTQAQALLAEMKLRSRGSDYVFASDLRTDRPISENTVLYLIGRMGYKDQMTGHGFRTLGSTWGNENGYNSDWIETQLAHAEDNDVRGAYNQAQYLEPRRKMLQDWANWLEQPNTGLVQIG